MGEWPRSHLLTRWLDSKQVQWPHCTFLSDDRLEVQLASNRGFTIFQYILGIEVDILKYESELPNAKVEASMKAVRWKVYSVANSLSTEGNWLFSRGPSSACIQQKVPTHDREPWAEIPLYSAWLGCERWFENVGWIPEIVQ